MWIENYFEMPESHDRVKKSYGENYEWVFETKKKYDPYNFF